MQLNRRHAIVVFSGGQDSTTCLGWAMGKYDKVSCISFDYGQRHRAEVAAADRVRQHFEEKYDVQIPHEILGVGSHMLLSASPLTSDNELETYLDHSSMEKIIGDRVEKTFVPMRNTLFLTLAANRAVATGAGTLITGVCEADNANYPDCTRQFIDNMQTAINSSLGLNIYHGLKIETPLMRLSKASTVLLAVSLPYTYEALAYSHTAYDGKYPPMSKDHASVLRAHGFEQAGHPDPLVVRAWREGLMPLPQTSNYDSIRADLP